MAGSGTTINQMDWRGILAQSVALIMSMHLSVAYPSLDGVASRVSLPKTDPAPAHQRRRHAAWANSAKLILAKEDVRTVSRALELALFMDAKFDVSKVPAK